MGVNPADPGAEKAFGLNEAHHFIVMRLRPRSEMIDPDRVSTRVMRSFSAVAGGLA